MRFTSDLSVAMAELSRLPTPLKGEPVIQLRPVLPPGQLNALSRSILRRRFSQVPLQPNLKELIVAITVMAATVAVSLSGFALV